MLSSEVDRKMNAVVVLLSTQLEALIQSVAELTDRSSIRPIGSNKTSERWSSLGQLSNMVTGVDMNPFFEQHPQHRHNPVITHSVDYSSKLKKASVVATQLTQLIKLRPPSETN